MFGRRVSARPRSIGLFSAVSVGFILLFSSNAHGHGVVGDRIFLSPIVGNDAFPDNAFSLTTRRSDFDFSPLPALEKQLSDNSSLLVTGGWEQQEPGPNPDVSGASDLSLYFRQAVYKSVSHEFELTVSPLIVVPTGTRQIADHGYTHLGGELLLGKGMGDLPDRPSQRYLRPFAVQAEVGYAGRIQGPANSDLVANFEVEYSLRYLDQFVQHIGIEAPWVNLVPYAQFNYSQSLMASHLTTLPDFRLTPGTAYLGEYFEVSFGAQVALNGAAPTGDRVAVIGLVEVFYDEIVPALGWKPF